MSLETMNQTNYFSRYLRLRLTRDENGVLVAELHKDGGPLNFTAQDHTELVDAFYNISADRSNMIVILTGVGGEFIPTIDFSSFGNVADPGVWSQVHDEGVQILENLANIRVPVIAAVVQDGTALDRARKLAAIYLKAPEITRRNARQHFIQPLKERIVREVGYALSLEGASAADLVKSIQARAKEKKESKKQELMASA